MSAITYSYTITDASWYDARPLMANWLKIRDEINGNLDDENLRPNSHYTWTRLIVADGFEADQIQPSGNFTIQPAQGGVIGMQVGFTDIMVVGDDGLALG